MHTEAHTVCRGLAHDKVGVFLLSSIPTFYIYTPILKFPVCICSSWSRLRGPSVLTGQDVFVSVLLDVLLLLPGVGGVDLLRPVFGREPPQPLRKTRKQTAALSVLSLATCQSNSGVATRAQGRQRATVSAFNTHSRGRAGVTRSDCAPLFTTSESP